MKLTNRRQTDSILDDILAEIVEVDRHFHNREIWFGKTPVQTATDWGTPDSLAPFRAISGLGVYGADANDEALVLGTADTPYDVTMTYFDPHTIFVVDFSHAAPYMIRLIWGTGTMAQAIIDEQFSLIPAITTNLPVAQSGGYPFPVKVPRKAADTQVWVQCKNANNNAYIDFLLGIHEYEV